MYWCCRWTLVAKVFCGKRKATFIFGLPEDISVHLHRSWNQIQWCGPVFMECHRLTRLLRFGSLSAAPTSAQS
jgi:hypothetical protein